MNAVILRPPLFVRTVKAVCVFGGFLHISINHIAYCWAGPCVTMMLVNHSHFILLLLKFKFWAPKTPDIVCLYPPLYKK